MKILVTGSAGFIGFSLKSISFKKMAIIFME